MPCVLRSNMTPKMFSLLQRIECAIDTALLFGKTITYSQLAKVVGGYSPRNIYIAECLGTLQDEDRAAGRSLRSAAVVRKSTGMPSHGFFRYAKVADQDESFWKSQARALGIKV